MKDLAVDKKQIALIAVLVLAILGGMGYYSSSVLSNKWKFSPEKVFEEAFDEPVARAEHLTGDRDPSGDFNTWLHFKYPHIPVQKNKDQWKDAMVDEGRMWFAEKYPEDKALNELQFLKLQRRTWNDAVSVTNEWLLVNKHTDDCYYRIWGTSR